MVVEAKGTTGTTRGKKEKWNGSLVAVVVVVTAAAVAVVVVVADGCCCV